jgi:hypothetical protein
MKTKITTLILLLATVSIAASVALYPVSVSEPYTVTQQHYENYTVTEPKEVTVADLSKQDINVTRNVSGTVLKYVNMNYVSGITSCGNISYAEKALSHTAWGSIFTLPYNNESYFAGYKGRSAAFTSYYETYTPNQNYVLDYDTYTYNLGTRTGNLYKIIRDDIINVSLHEGEIYSSQGYNLQVNKIGQVASTTTSCPPYYANPEYNPDNPESNSCITNTTNIQGATVTLSTPGVSQTWDVQNDTNLVYTGGLKGGENVPSILMHVKTVNNTSVTLDAIFQISTDPVPTGDIGAMVSVLITNKDTVPGTFQVYQGFILNATTHFEVGKLSTVYLQPHESRSLAYTTSQTIQNCRSYSQSISKSAIPENITEIQNVGGYIVRTTYRNVTQYVDVTKTKLVEVNVTKYRNRTIPFIFKTLKGV